MSISIWMLCDPGLCIPFGEHMENQCMQTPGSDGGRIQGHSCEHFWSGKAVGWLEIAHTSQDRRHTVLHSRRSCQPAPRGFKPCSASCCKAMSYNSQNSTDLLFHSLYFKSFLFHEEKETSHDALGSRNKHLHFHFIFCILSLLFHFIFLSSSLYVPASSALWFVAMYVSLEVFSIGRVWYETQISRIQWYLLSCWYPILVGFEHLSKYLSHIWKHLAMSCWIPEAVAVALLNNA